MFQVMASSCMPQHLSQTLDKGFRSPKQSLPSAPNTHAQFSSLRVGVCLFSIFLLPFISVLESKVCPQRTAFHLTLWLVCVLCFFFFFNFHLFRETGRGAPICQFAPQMSAAVKQNCQALAHGGRHPERSGILTAAFCWFAFTAFFWCYFLHGFCRPYLLCIQELLQVCLRQNGNSNESTSFLH